MIEKAQKTNWFVRILIMIFSTLLAWMVYASFTKSASPFSLNAGTITLIGIITIVILSESFNNLSVGQLISLSRKAEKIEEENEKLEKENSSLSLQIVQMAQIVTNFKQTQINSNTPTYIFTQAQAQNLGVVQAPQDEKISESAAEESVGTKDVAAEEPRRLNSYIRSKIYRKIEELSLNKYREIYKLPILDFQKDVKFSEAFEKIDPIMERGIIFDGYLLTPSKEYFFEVRVGNISNPMFWDRIYIMLAKILFYRQAKNIQAELTLINVEIPEETADKHYYSPERFFQTFQPAIANNLLKIETIKFSKDEYEEIVKSVSAENPQTTA